MYDFIYYQARDVMTTSLVTIDETTSIKEAADLLAEHDFNCLPVVDEAGRLIGMVTKLDVLKSFRFTDKLKIPPYNVIMIRDVSEVMTRDIAVVEPETPLTRVLEDMIDHRFKGLPVVEGEVLVGIVSREDVLEALRRSARGLPPDRLVVAAEACMEA